MDISGIPFRAMRAISLWQPWASAVALGSKKVETRHWSTAYRGPLVIHAAKRRVRSELVHIGTCWNWCGALREIHRIGRSEPLTDSLPFGKLIAVLNLIDCRPTDCFAYLDTPRRPRGETSDLYDWTERQLGDFSLGRFGWEFENIYRLPEPIPFIGRQGFFNVPDELLPVLARPTALGGLF